MMKAKVTLFLAVAVAVQSCAPAAQNESPAPSGLAAAVEPWAQSGELNGVVRIERDGEVIFEKAYGLASVELGVPNTETTKFKLHSLSKPMTAAAVLRAAAQGRLDLDDSICDRLDPCPESWRPATIRSLLNHSSGIPDFSNLLLDNFNGGIAETYSALETELADLNPSFSPGSEFRYSNTGYVLLASILERAYGASFAEVMRTQIFGPAEMKNSGVEEAPAAGANYDGPLVIDGMAAGYNGSVDGLQQAFSKMYVIPGAGGIYSTAEDVGAFANAVFDGDLLPPELLGEMVEPDPAIGVSYGLGIVTRKDDNGVLSYRHDGGNNGYLSWMEYFPEQKITIAIMTNFGFAPIADIRAALWRALSVEETHQSIDECLDRGGCWDYEAHACRKDGQNAQSLCDASRDQPPSQP